MADAQEVVVAIDCARLAQCSRTHIEQDRKFVYHCNDGTNSEWIHGTHGDDVLCIAFNGTNSGTDWFYNFIAVPEPLELPGVSGACKCHFGFSSKYLSVKDDIMAVVRGCDKKTILVTGHSLGAAQATLCGLHIQMTCPDRDVRVYAFGVPKVGNAEFASLYNSMVKVSKFYIYGNDIIESVPPWALGYTYTTPITRLGHRQWYKPWSTADHDIMNYKNALNRPELQSRSHDTTTEDVECIKRMCEREYTRQRARERRCELRHALGANGEVLCCLNSGVADVITNNEIIVVKEAHKWKNALGRALAYVADPHAHDQIKPHIHLFSFDDAFDYTEPARVCAKYNCLLTHETVAP